MYAIIDDRGRQYRAAPGDKLTLDRSDAEVGSTLDAKVLLVADGATVKVGAPYVAGAKATLKVVSHTRGDKLIVSKYKRRKHNLRRNGHRSEQTVVEVVAIA
jgi:large subunit ribosomal protein L21